jgi:peptide deformylase
VPLISDKTPLKSLRILSYPDPALAEPAAPVEKIDDLVRARAQRMIELMREAKGVGLAAPQIGWPVRLCVLALDTEAKQVGVFINPKIIRRIGTQNEEEGCLSVPHIRANIKRPLRLVAQATNLEGQEIRMEAEGLLARAWQHEIDHLEGRLIVQRMTPATRLANEKRLKELEREFEENPST